MKILLQIFFILFIATSAQAEIVTQDIKYSSGGTSLKGYLAYDDSVRGKRPGVLVVHEWWGHNEHARNRAKMLAELGYTALAIDMYGDGKTADHPKGAGELMNAAFSDWDASAARFRAAKQVLQNHKTVDAERIASIGFCFGGAVSLRMARAGEDLDAVVAFHSALPVDSPISNDNVKASILVINGSQDGFLKPETVATFMQQMMSANADVTYTTLRGVRHSYTNPQADEFGKKFNIGALKYDAAADKRSWAAMQEFFKRVFSNEPS